MHCSRALEPMLRCYIAALAWLATADISHTCPYGLLYTPEPECPLDAGGSRPCRRSACRPCWCNEGGSLPCRQVACLQSGEVRSRAASQGSSTTPAPGGDACRKSTHPALPSSCGDCAWACCWLVFTASVLDLMRFPAATQKRVAALAAACRKRQSRPAVM